MEKESTITVSMKVETQKAEEQARELIHLLESANSLSNELADTLNNLKIDFKV